jgi:hypothetical protein
MRTTRTSPSRVYDAAAGAAVGAIAPANAAVRRDALLAKMAADRARLRFNLARDDSQYSDNSPGTWARLQNTVNPGAMPSSEAEFELSPAGPSQFMSDHALSVTAAVLGLLVLGPRKAVFAVLRNLAPLLLARGVRMLFDQHDRSIADSGESADRRLNARSSMRLGAAGERDSARSLDAVSEVSNEVPDEVHKGRRADTARFAAGTDSKRNPH